MKKVLTLIILFSSIFLLTGCDDSNKYLQEVSLNKLYNMAENKETFILEIVQDGCSYCSSFKPTFKKVLGEYEVTANYLNISKLTEEEYYQFIDDFNDGEELSTPTVLFFENGHEKTSMNRIIGAASEKEVIRKLKQNNYIED